MFSKEPKQTLEQRFLAMLRDRPDALESKQQFSGLLKDHFPQERAMAQIMAVLYDMGAHTEIAGAGRVTRDLAYRFAKRLVDERGIDRRDAEGAVGLLCACYAEFLGKPCDLAMATDGGAEVGGGASHGQGLKGAEARKPGARPAQASSPRLRHLRRMATGSLALGVVSVCSVIVPVLFIIPSAFGIWLGDRSRKQLAEIEGPTDLATAGIVLNAIAMLAGVILQILFFTDHWFHWFPQNPAAP